MIIITEQEYQQQRKRERRTRYITAAIIAVPMLFILASTLRAIQLMWIH